MLEEEEIVEGDWRGFECIHGFCWEGECVEIWFCFDLAVKRVKITLFCMVTVCLCDSN